MITLIPDGLSDYETLNDRGVEWKSCSLSSPVSTELTPSVNYRYLLPSGRTLSKSSGEYVEGSIAKYDFDDDRSVVVVNKYNPDHFDGPIICSYTPGKALSVFYSDDRVSQQTVETVLSQFALSVESGLDEANPNGSDIIDRREIANILRRVKADIDARKQELEAYGKIALGRFHSIKDQPVPPGTKDAHTWKTVVQDEMTKQGISHDQHQEQLDRLIWAIDDVRWDIEQREAALPKLVAKIFNEEVSPQAVPGIAADE